MAKIIQQLFHFPPERELLLDDLVVPMPSDTPDLQQVLCINTDNHQQQMQYTLEGDAYSAYTVTSMTNLSDKR